MSIKQIIYLSFLILGGCKNSSHVEVPVNNSSNIVVAIKFIDAFYSFNRDSLASLLSNAEASQPNILYYQKWAECAHYEILKRNTFFEPSDSLVIFPVTVKDDLMAALKIAFNVTDTFHISFRHGRIRSVETASNDLNTYYDAKSWVKQNRPEFIEKPCEGIWDGGPTPCECVKGMLKGFVEFEAVTKVK
ncbi:MAG: hypothetical protein ABIS36_14790 [Chryseolinea sp.]